MFSLNRQPDTAPFAHKHLTGIAQLSAADIVTILDCAQSFADDLAEGHFESNLLSGRVIVNLFFENSTRTRTSFEMAALKLGASVINWDERTSSLSKGETFLDTVLNIDAMGPDALIIRHHEFGAPEYVSKRVKASVINAGDSWREHPTQALLDALTIRQAKGKIEGLRVAIVGDIAHSRVAASNMLLLPKLGVNVHAIAPTVLMPEKLPDGVAKFDTLGDGLKDCDIVITLRLQKERMQGALIDSETDYFRQYGLTHDTLRFAKPDALVLDPGPVIRGVQMSDDLADDQQRSLILKQVSNGVAVRMAVLDLLLNRKRNEF